MGCLLLSGSCLHPQAPSAHRFRLLGMSPNDPGFFPFGIPAQVFYYGRMQPLVGRLGNILLREPVAPYLAPLAAPHVAPVLSEGNGSVGGLHGCRTIATKPTRARTSVDGFLSASRRACIGPSFAWPRR